jgi:hypothetical protein
LPLPIHINLQLQDFEGNIFKGYIQYATGQKMNYLQPFEFMAKKEKLNANINV